MIPAGSLSIRSRAALTVGAAVAFTMSALVVSGDELGEDWFGDEMWRANFVRSPRWWSLYRSWDTPTPPGFILLFRTLSLVLPNGPTALRVATLLGLVVSLVLLTHLLLAIAQREPAVDLPRTSPWPRPTAERSQAAMSIAVLAACVALPMLNAVGTHRIFVPYFLETAFAAALILGCVMLDRKPAAWPVLLAVMVATPLFAIASMFLLPATAGYVLWWARRRDDRRCLWWTAAASGTGLMVSLAVYLVAYRPVAKDSITGYWGWAALRHHPGRFGELVERTADLYRDGILGWAHPSWAHRFGVVVWAGLVVCTVVGLVSLGRRWPPLLAFLASAWLCIVGASFVAGWPMIAERVNLAVFMFAYAITLYGAVRVVSLAAGERLIPTAIAGALLIGGLWPAHQTGLFGDAFLRGLTSDLRVVADSPAQQNLVLTYHFSARWYAEDALVTARPGGRDYELMSETYTDLSVYDRAVLGTAVAALPSGAAVWCVMPFDVGPEATERACQLPPGLQPIVDQHGSRSIIRGYVKP